MSLVSILLYAIAVMTLMIGAISFVGASRSDRKRTIWVLLSDIGAFVWIISMATFLRLEPAGANVDSEAVYSIHGIYIGTLVMVVMILGYASWQYLVGKIATIVSVGVAILLAVMLIMNPGLLYSGYLLTNAGNTVYIVNGWYYWVYALSLMMMIAFFIGATYYRAKQTSNKRAKIGDKILAAGFVVVGVVSAIFDLILPLFGKYDLIWMGPLALSLTMLSYFYAILKYRIVSVSVGWMRTLAYVVLLSTGAVAYMVIFYLIFTALFKIPNPSTSVLVLNFLMIVIVLLLIPVINELKASMNSLILVGQVDIAYAIKKLNKIASKNIDLRDLAGFLADNLHFAYVGFVVNGRLYSSKPLAMSADEIKQISHMKQAHGSDVWQEPNKSVQKILDEMDLKAVAELRNAKGKPFGQLIVGKPIGKSGFERRDLIQLEMIINLVATVIDSEKHIRA